MVNIPRIGLKLWTKRFSDALNRIWWQPAAWCKVYSITKLPSEIIILPIGYGGKEGYSFALPISKYTWKPASSFLNEKAHNLRCYASTDILEGKKLFYRMPLLLFYIVGLCISIPFIAFKERRKHRVNDTCWMWKMTTPKRDILVLWRGRSSREHESLD